MGGGGLRFPLRHSRASSPPSPRRTPAARSRAAKSGIAPFHGRRPAGRSVGIVVCACPPLEAGIKYPSLQLGAVTGFLRSRDSLTTT